VLSLWRSTNLPYESCGHDPFSPEYRAWVLEIYRAIAGGEYNPLNELTSTKQGKDLFKIGYPYHSRNPAVVASTYAQLTQALNSLNEKPPASVIEFGAGWGNLALPIARTGYSVTVLDIDKYFIKRLKKEASRAGVKMSFVVSGFLEFVSEKRGAYDVVIFQQSFHHCDDPLRLLIGIRENVLAANGSVYFFSEPITKELVFPWGLRYDGESLWAIGCNKWFEVGFQQDFFASLLLRGGYWCKVLPGIAGHVGEAFLATPASNRMDFGELLLPSAIDETWHTAEQAGDCMIRYSRGQSRLPSLEKCPTGGFYEITLINFGSVPLRLSVRTATTHDVTIMPQGHIDLKIDATGGDVAIDSDTFVPAETGQTGDTRILGVALSNIRTTRA